uniref:C-type lectin domain-containing protein n=1 Tax=Oreochromis aureus TaxID=47969 RepID=A0AAZ1XMZ6_OREAU
MLLVKLCTQEFHSHVLYQCTCTCDVTIKKKDRISRNKLLKDVFVCFSVCFTEMKKDKKTFYLIKEKKNWTQAQNYCRYNYTDLASGLDQVDGEEMKDLINSNGDSMSVWVGLFRDSWRWSDGSDFSFRYWDMELFNDTQSNKTCAMTLLNRSGKWSSDECGKEKPFFCYDGEFLSTCV